MPCASVALKVRLEWPPAISSNVNGAVAPATLVGAATRRPARCRSPAWRRRTVAASAAAAGRRRLRRSGPYDRPPWPSARAARPRPRTSCSASSAAMAADHVLRDEAARRPLDRLLLAVPPQPALRRAGAAGAARAARRGGRADAAGGASATASPRRAGAALARVAGRADRPSRPRSATSGCSSSSSAPRPATTSAGALAAEQHRAHEERHAEYEAAPARRSPTWPAVAAGHARAGPRYERAAADVLGRAAARRPTAPDGVAGRRRVTPTRWCRAAST